MKDQIRSNAEHGLVKWTEEKAVNGNLAGFRLPRDLNK